MHFALQLDIGRSWNRESGEGGRLHRLKPDPLGCSSLVVNNANTSAQKIDIVIMVASPYADASEGSPDGRGVRVNRSLRMSYPESVSGPRCCHTPNSCEAWAGRAKWTREVVIPGVVSGLEFFMAIACDRSPPPGKDHVSVLSMRTRHAVGCGCFQSSEGHVHSQTAAYAEASACHGSFGTRKRFWELVTGRVEARCGAAP